MIENTIDEPIRICVVRPQETVDYAAEELCKYLCLMAGSHDAAIVINEIPDNDDGGLELGLFSDFDLRSEEMKAPEQDDAIYGSSG